MSLKSLKLQIQETILFSLSLRGILSHRLINSVSVVENGTDRETADTFSKHTVCLIQQMVTEDVVSTLIHLDQVGFTQGGF